MSQSPLLLLSTLDASTYTVKNLKALHRTVSNPGQRILGRMCPSGGVLKATLTADSTTPAPSPTAQSTPVLPVANTLRFARPRFSPIAAPPVRMPRPYSMEDPRLRWPPRPSVFPTVQPRLHVPPVSEQPPLFSPFVTSPLPSPVSSPPRRVFLYQETRERFVQMEREAQGLNPIYIDSDENLDDF